MDSFPGVVFTKKDFSLFRQEEKAKVGHLGGLISNSQVCLNGTAKLPIKVLMLDLN